MITLIAWKPATVIFLYGGTNIALGLSIPR
jgi:hypothetical protein